MEGNLLLQRYSLQVGIFRGYFEKISANPEMEDIHQLRLAIKRLRALLHLCEVVSRSAFRQNEHLLLFDSLFKEAGKLREIQINESLLISCGIEVPPAYTEYLGVIRTAVTGSLLEETEKFDFKQLEALDAGLENTIDPIPEQDIIRDAETEVLNQLRVIQELRRKPVSRKKLHKIRMRLKVIIELLRLIGESSHFSDLVNLEPGCVQLSRQLGKWHDLEMLLRSLRDFMPEPNDKDTLKIIRKAVRIIRRDCARLRKKTGKDLVKELP